MDENTDPQPLHGGKANAAAEKTAEQNAGTAAAAPVPGWLAKFLAPTLTLTLCDKRLGETQSLVLQPRFNIDGQLAGLAIVLEPDATGAAGEA